MDFGSSHIFTQVESDTEELTPADFDSGIYQPIGSSLSAHGPGFYNQHDVLYDNVIKRKDGGRPQVSDEPVYDNRGLNASAPRAGGASGGAYADTYDVPRKFNHPYDYPLIGSYRVDEPPPLPPMRKAGTGGADQMEDDDATYGGLGGQYMTLMNKTSSKIRRADTNIVAVKFDKLVQSEQCEGGTPVFCGKCGAAMSSLSTVSDLHNGKCWICEFCEHENPLSADVTPPQEEDCTYYMGQGSGGEADTVVIFCVDVSGSMAVTTEVSHKVERKMNDEEVALQAFQEELDVQEQRRRQAAEEALTAQLVAGLQGTIDEQAQALEQFQLSRTGSTVPPPVPPHPSAMPAPSAMPPASASAMPPASATPTALATPTTTASATPTTTASATPTATSQVQPTESQPTPSAPPLAPTLPPRASLGQDIPPPLPPHASSDGGADGSLGSQVLADVDARYVASPQKTPVAAPRKSVTAPQMAPKPAPVEPRKLVSYVSRLQSMKLAIQQQVTKLREESSQTRVGLVAFNNDVTVIGDGTEEPVPLEGAGLTDKDSLISLVQMFPLPGPIAQVHESLTGKIFGLTESGQTALGPALLIAISMAAQKPGSKVIMCTDGMANVGLGALHNMENDAAYDQAATFYEEVANFARDSGVCVSVLTLEGEDCRAIELGQVADKTRGQVNIVKPDDLNQQFADILADRILATNVSAKMVLHKGLFFRDSESDTGDSQATNTVGIVTADSETTFEFGVKRKEVIYDNYGGTSVVFREDEPLYESVKQSTLIEGLERLPFQVQIRYTGRDGREFLRILTMDRPVTKDRKFAEQNANVGVIGAHAVQSAAKLAVEGHYDRARINAVITQKLVQRCTKPEDGEEQEGIYETFLKNMAPIQSEISKAQQHLSSDGVYMTLVAARGERLPSEGDANETDETLIAARKNKMSKKPLRDEAGYIVMKQRRKHVSDRQASVFYRMKGATTKMFNKQTYSFADA